MGAASGTPPANINTTFQLCLSSSSCGSYVEYINYTTILPTVSDLQIVGPGNTVSYADDPDIATPAPIMIGQQAELEASPAPSLSAVVWAYESSPPSNVVGGYGLNASPAPSGSQTPAAAIASPSPAPTLGNPIKVYWIASSATGIRHVRMTAAESGVTGPLFADVYYPITSPGAVVSASTMAADVYDTYPLQGYSCSGSLGTAISAGDWECSPGNGITWKFSVEPLPSYGTGLIGMAQLVTAYSVTGTVAGKAYTVSPPPGTPAPLDFEFPSQGFYQSTSDSTPLSNFDSPGYVLSGQACNPVSNSGSFADYFMYFPNGTNRPSIWVTLAVGTWGWAGTGTKNTSGAWIASPPPTNPSPNLAPSSVLPDWLATAQSLDKYYGVPAECATPTPAPED
jgi:hypothetical protein